MAGTIMVPYFSAYLSIDQPLSSGTLTKMQCDAKCADSNDWYDSTTHRFTPLLAGKYRVTASYIGTGRAITISLIRIYKNSSPINESSTIDVRAVQPARSVSAIVDMNGTTDYLEAWASITGTDPLLAGGAAPQYTWFDAQYVAP